MSDVGVTEFEPAHAEAFKALNIAWIERHYAVEPKDLELLEDPQGSIIAKGGCIFMAKAHGRIIGCVALLPLADGGYEVSKMAVAEDARRMGAGRALLSACRDWALARGAPRLYLESGLALTPALALYRAFGFHDLPPERRPPSPYARVSVWMELPLSRGELSGRAAF
jgi:GNAT superfamily N-acetyltransferase